MVTAESSQRFLRTSAASGRRFFIAEGSPDAVYPDVEAINFVQSVALPELRLVADSVSAQSKAQRRAPAKRTRRHFQPTPKGGIDEQSYISFHNRIRSSPSRHSQPTGGKNRSHGMMADVEFLRSAARSEGCNPTHAQAMQQAADEIEQLRNANALLTSRALPPANWFERLLIGVLILVILMGFVGSILRG